MPKQGKLGLIIGMGLVVLIALIFFNRGRNEPARSKTSANNGKAQPVSTLNQAASRSLPKVVPVRAVSEKTSATKFETGRVGY